MIARACHTWSKTSELASGVGALRPEMTAAKAAACSGVIDADIDPVLFGTTPISVFVSGRNPTSNRFREKLKLTASDYASALGVKGAYQSRYRLAQERFYGRQPAPPSEFISNLMSEGNRMEPYILNRWRARYPNYIALPSGLLLDEVYPDKFGATPDALVFDRQTMTLVGVLELKYRPMAKELSTSQGLIPPKYYIQMVGQLMCLPGVYRWFYMEHRDDEHEYSYTDLITENTKQTVREDLLLFLRMAETCTEATFPKRCPAWDLNRL